MSRVNQRAPGQTELEQVWGLRPDYYQLFMKDYARAVARVEPVLFELCRLRIAQMVESHFDLALRYKAAFDAGLNEEKIAALADYPTSPLFDEVERAALEFTEQWVIQSSGITDEDVERVQSLMAPEQFIYFCRALSVADQFARANSAFRIVAPDVAPNSMPAFAIL